MAKRLQFRLRTLLLAVVPVALVALPVGYLLRLPQVPRPVPVGGTVTLDGIPLDGAMVCFVPVDSQENAANGISDIAGRFKSLTLVDYGVVLNGVYPGSYRVTVRTTGDFPTKFRHEETSGLTVEVTEDGPNVFDFNLTTP